VAVLAVLLPSAACLITYLFALEVMKYRLGRLTVSRRRFRLRCAAWFVTVALCGAVFTGLFLLPHGYALRHPAVVATLWLSCLTAAIALIVIMYADIKEVESRVQAHEVELWRDFARTLAEKEKRRHPDAPSDQDQPKA
jgi:hypothetical protein